MSAPNPSTALARVLVDELVRCGVEHVVLSPGSRSTALALAVVEEPRLRLHVQLDERSAGFVAVGIARTTGRPAAVVTTSGSATANLHPAVVEADTGRVPLLVLTTDRPPELRHTASNQTIDQLRLYGTAVRWFCEVGVPEPRPGAVAYWRSTVGRAVAEATGVRDAPGPVHLNLAFREPTVPETDDGRTRGEPFPFDLSGRAGGAPWVTTTRPPPTLSADEIGALAGRIAATERGLVVLGDSPDDLAPALDVAERAGWPVVAEPLSNARLDGRAIVHAAQLTAVPEFAAAHRPDLVLRVGRTGLARGVGELLGADVPQLVLDRFGTWLDPHRAIAELVVADPTRTCAAVAEALAAPAGSTWLDAWRAADAAAAHAIEDVLAAEDGPTEPGVARDVAAAVPDGGTLVVGSSMPVRDLDGYLRPRRGLRILGNRGASGIDGFVSTALGVALAGGGAPTVALCGDLTLLHDANGFLLDAGVDRLDLTLVVVHNDGGGIFSFLPQARYAGAFERVFGTPHGRDLAAIARLHGLAHVRVDRAVDVAPAVREGLDVGGVRLVEVRTDRRANVDLHRRIQAAVAAVL